MNEDFNIGGGHGAGGSSDYFRTQGLMHQPPNPGMRYIYSNCSCEEESSCVGSTALIGLLLLIVGYITDADLLAIGGICVLALAALMSRGDRSD